MKILPKTTKNTVSKKTGGKHCPYCKPFAWQLWPWFSNRLFMQVISTPASSSTDFSVTVCITARFRGVSSCCALGMLVGSLPGLTGSSKSSPCGYTGSNPMPNALASVFRVLANTSPSWPPPQAVWEDLCLESSLLLLLMGHAVFLKTFYLSFCPWSCNFIFSPSMQAHHDAGKKGPIWVTGRLHRIAWQCQGELRLSLFLQPPKHWQKQRALFTQFLPQNLSQFFSLFSKARRGWAEAAALIFP